MAQLAQDRSSEQMRNARARSSYPADWYLEDDEDVGQDPDHQEDEFFLQSTLLAWKKRTGQNHLLVGCEMVCRWDEAEPLVGVDPDVYIAERPPGDETGYIGSLKTWREGNYPPMLAIEIVSKWRPKKDYRYSPRKHDLLGTGELWVFDPHLFGYTEEQPPVLLQVFERETNDRLVQKYAGAGPYWSDALHAWVMVIERDLIIANDPEGKDRWPTLEEEERRRAEAFANQANEAAKKAADEAKRADDEAKRADDEAKRADEERQAKDAALAQVAELKALLARRSS